MPKVPFVAGSNHQWLWIVILVLAIGCSQPTAKNKPADWSDADFVSQMHYVVITTPGPNEGRATTIASHTADTLVLVDDLSVLSPAPGPGDTYEIRPYNSIANIFGENNEAGLQEGPNFRT